MVVRLCRIAALAVAATSLLVAASAVMAVPVNKCLVNGTVTYQSDPCPSGRARKQPSVQELNAQEQSRRKAATTTATATATAADRTVPAVTTAPEFRCDGRQLCSQMSSCAEAKYFLANCPGVKMDGDHNGIPCERQWCNP